MKIYLTFICNCFIIGLIYGQSGSVDVSFAPLDLGFQTTEGFSNAVNTTYEQTDGKLLVGGSFAKFNQLFLNKIVRLNIDGTVDSTFEIGNGFDGHVRFINCQNDGKILVSGNFTTFNGNVAKSLTRLHPNGSIDSSFLFSDFAPNMITIRTMKILSNGKIVIGGDFQLFHNGVNYSNIIRLNSDGTIDSSFAIGYGFNNSVHSITEDDNLGLYVVGNFTFFDSIPANRITKLNYDGSIDATFNPGLGFVDEVHKIIRQTDGKLIVNTGNTQFYNGNQLNKLVRLFPNGDIDLSFTSPFNTNSTSAQAIYDIVLNQNNKIVCVGPRMEIDTISASVFLLNQDGSRDSTFQRVIQTKLGYITNVNCFNTNTYLNGDFLSCKGLPKSNLCRLINDTLIDYNFLSTIGANYYASDIKFQSNGKIILTGPQRILSQYDKNYVPGLFRINEDGTFDSTFVLDNINVPASLDSKILIFNNDKIIYVRDFATWSWDSQNPKFLKLNADGTIDLSFDTLINDHAFFGNKGKMMPLADGSFIHNTYSASYYKLSKMLGNGLEDQLFNANTNNTGYVSDFCILPDSRIAYIQPNVIGFCDADGTHLSSIPYYYSAQKIDYQNNNNIVILVDNGFECNMVRFNQNNEIDTTFLIDTSIIKKIINFNVLPDNKIIAYGDLDEADGISNNIVFRLNANGSIDSSFYIGSGANGEITCLAVDPNGNIIISGNFNGYNGIGRNRLARINNCFDKHIYDTIVSCNPAGYYWAENGQTYTISGVYYDTVVTSNGCNRFVQLNLEILNNSFYTDNQHSCDSYTWINGITYVESNDTSVFILQNAVGCDSIITLNLTINQPSTATDIISHCGPYTWIDGITYTVSNTTATYILPNAAGCDSTITLDLTVTQDQPISSSVFVHPSDVNLCTGNAAISITGNGLFEIEIDGNSNIISSNGFTEIMDLCSGIHTLKITNPCDTLIDQFVIPTEASYTFDNNGFTDSTAVDSLGITVINCEIDYGSIDSVYIDSLWTLGDTVYTIWNVVDANGPNYDTLAYVLNNGAGVYYLQYSFFCPNRGLGDYFTAGEAIYFGNGAATTSLTELENLWVNIYPNPTHSSVTIQINEPNAMVRVYDVQGKLIVKQKIQSQDTISLHDLQSGVYLFEIQTANNKLTQRIIKL